MKHLKKFLVAIIAVAMACTVALFAACIDSNAENPVDKEQVNAILNTVISQPAQHAELSGTVDMTIAEKYETYNTQNVKLDGKSDTMSGTVQATGKLNVAQGDGDLCFTATSGASSQFMYAFMRNWVVTTHQSSSPVTDFTGRTLNYAADLKAELGDILEGSDVTLGQLASVLLVPVLTADLSYAADLGAVTQSGDTLTVDVNLAIYNQVQKVKTFLEKINDNTTLREILAFDEVKGIIDELTTGLDGATMQVLFASVIESIGQEEVQPGVTIEDVLAEQNIDLSSLVVAADANSTAYQYILKVLASDELNNLVKLIASENGVTNMPDLLDINFNYIKTIIAAGSDLTVQQVPGMAVIKAAFAEMTSGITATECKISVNNYDFDVTAPVSYNDLVSYMSLSNCKIRYNISGEKLTDISVKCAVAVQNSTIEVADTWIYRQQKINGNVDVTLKLTDTVYSLTDIDNCVIG